MKSFLITLPISIAFVFALSHFGLYSFASYLAGVILCGIGLAIKN